MAAIILFGDPSHVANATYNKGTADNDGVCLPNHFQAPMLTVNQIFPRDDNDACEEISDRIVSYCDTGDVYCDAGDGESDRDVHGAYIERYGDDVVDFIVERYEEETGDSVGDASTTGSGSSATTASPTSSGTEATSATATETETETETATETNATASETETGEGSATTTAEEGAATETGEGENVTAGLVVPGLGVVGLASLAVLGLM